MVHLIIIGIILCILAFGYLTSVLFNDPVVESANYNYKDSILTVTYTNGKVHDYIKAYGDWNDFPMMTFVGRTKSNQLNNVYYYIQKWGNDYPTAHLKKTHDTFIG